MTHQHTPRFAVEHMLAHTDLFVELEPYTSSHLRHTHRDVCSLVCTFVSRWSSVLSCVSATNVTHTQTARASGYVRVHTLTHTQTQSQLSRNAINPTTTIPPLHFLLLFVASASDRRVIGRTLTYILRTYVSVYVCGFI